MIEYTIQAGYAGKRKACQETSPCPPLNISYVFLVYVVFVLYIFILSLLWCIMLYICSFDIAGFLYICTALRPYRRTVCGLLLFATCMKQIQTVGFIEKPEIIFHHRDSIAIAHIHTAEFPISNTCVLQLSLPILSFFSTEEGRPGFSITGGGYGEASSAGWGAPAAT